MAASLSATNLAGLGRGHLGAGAPESCAPLFGLLA